MINSNSHSYIAGWQIEALSELSRQGACNFKIKGCLSHNGTTFINFDSVYQ